MPGKRKYELKLRAERLEETRRRIVEATSDLHRTVGPAATQVTEVARRAGVQRRTIYNHFPDEATLLEACSSHWRARHPAPDPARWAAIAEPRERVAHALAELYAWYRATEPMTANVLRDAELMPALRRIVDTGLGAYLERVSRTLADSFRARGRRRARIEATVEVVVDFHTWRSLAPLGDVRAAELAAAWVELAADYGASSSAQATLT